MGKHSVLVFRNPEELKNAFNYTVMTMFFIDDLTDPMAGFKLFYSGELVYGIAKHGQIISNLTPKQKTSYILDNFSARYGNSVNTEESNIWAEYSLVLDCPCGMKHGFKSANDLPGEDLVCGLCGHKLITFDDEIDKRDAVVDFALLAVNIITPDIIANDVEDDDGDEWDTNYGEV